MKEIILFLNSDDVDLENLKRATRTLSHFQCEFTNSYTEAHEYIENHQVDYVISDFYLGDGRALELIQDFPDIPTMVITASGNIDLAIEAMKAGAREVLEKDVQGNFLKLMPYFIERMTKNHHLYTHLLRTDDRKLRRA